jgi:hypothetical protein
MNRKKRSGWIAVPVSAAAALIAAGSLIAAFSGCGGGGGGGGSVYTSRAYKGHASFADSNNFVAVYPQAVGTRLDDCQTCHASGTVKDAGDKNVLANPCTYCHYVIHPPEGWSNLPTNYGDTLNPYGVAYHNAGRTQAALLSIDKQDSDADGYTNGSEIKDLRYPGDAGSHPGLPLCSVLQVTKKQLEAMPRHTQFGLGNTSKQQFDFYETYTGVRIVDLLNAKGINLTGATNVDILAPDGFAQTFTVDEITKEYPKHRFYSGFGVADMGADCAFVEYPKNTYGLAYGQEIPDVQWHVLAFQRDGLPIEPSSLDPVSGKINGEGPFRNIIPPASSDPDLNTPDRGRNADTSGCTMHEWDYNAAKDHNATRMVKGAVILRIQPMPDGCEEFDLINGGWAMIQDQSLLIYGHGVSE